MSAPPLRALIVDDEAVARSRMRWLCAGVDGLEVVGEADSGAAALERIAELAPDLLLLDISMPGLDGLALARGLGRAASRPQVVFCTAHDGHALAAFDLAAVDYLLKPVSRERLARAVERAQRLRAQPQAEAQPHWLRQIWAPHRGAMLRIEVDDIDRIEAERDYVRLRVGAASYLVHDTMANIETRLDPDAFVRLRRSVIVRRRAIEGLRHEGAGAWTASMRDGGTVRIGPTYLADVKRSLGV